MSWHDLILVIVTAIVGHIRHVYKTRELRARMRKASDVADRAQNRVIDLLDEMNSAWSDGMEEAARIASSDPERQPHVIAAAIRTRIKDKMLTPPTPKVEEEKEGLRL